MFLCVHTVYAFVYNASNFYWRKLFYMKYLAKREGEQTFNNLVVAVGLPNGIHYKSFIFNYYSLRFTKIWLYQNYHTGNISLPWCTEMKA